MSAAWEAYADMLMQRCPYIKGAALYGLDGNLWGERGFHISAQEVQQVKTGFTAGHCPLHISGLKLNLKGQPCKFMVLNTDDAHMQARLGKCGGISAAKTNQAIVIAYYDVDEKEASAQVVSAVRSTVDWMQEYLMKQNY